MSNVLVFAEHQHDKFPKTTLVAVRAGQDLAEKTGGECHAAVLGTGVDALANELAEYGVEKVYAVEDAGARALRRRRLRAGARRTWRNDKGCDAVVATATAIGKDLLPRVAARLDAGIASDITGDQRRRHVRAADVRRQRHRDGRDRDGRRRSSPCAPRPSTPPPKGGKGEVEKVAARSTPAREDEVRQLRRDQVGPPGADRGAHRRLGRPRPEERRELHHRARAAGRRARRRDGRQPRGGRRRLRARTTCRSARPARSSRPSSTSRSASRAPSSTSPA